MRPRPSRFPVLRRPSRQRTVSLVLAVAAGLTVVQATAGAHRASARLGATEVVWVVVEDVDAGERIGPGAVARQARPVAFVPTGSMVEDPTGRTATEDLAAGEVVVGTRVAGSGSGATALVPDGWRAMAVPAFEALPPLRPGDRVDLVGSSPGGSGSALAAVLVADAIVVEVAGPESVTVAVPADRVPSVAAALTGGVVLVALVG